ncbi:MAG: amidohydrolase [Thermoleophilia bacterium]|nr:amidohydrolase [Thermoleophilia bacterium]
MGSIDVHHHIQPPEYVAAIGSVAIAGPAVASAVDWGAQRSLEAMDKNGIEAAVVSISAPGVWVGEQSGTTRLARVCNEFSAQLCADHPGRFGWLAALPLPDVGAALDETAYAFDQLGADGALLLTNYGNRYLGHPGFEPLLAELDGRGAVVALHPTSCDCLDAVPEIPRSVIEFPHDTTRTVCSLLFGGSLLRYPNIRWLLPHGGGTLAFLAHRIAGVLNLRPNLREHAPGGVISALQSLYYDTAFAANPPSFAALRELAPGDHILFGTDFPFAPEAFMAASVAGLAEVADGAAAFESVSRRNAQTLFPRFAEHVESV